MWFAERAIVSQTEGLVSVLAAPYHVPDLGREPIEIFHIDDDPLELSPLSGEALAEALAVIRSRLPLAPLSKLVMDAEAEVVWDRDTEDQLRALGYIE